jgi:hypothetical protein
MELKGGMVSVIPDKPGTIIDPGFVSYTGIIPSDTWTESVERDHCH